MRKVGKQQSTTARPSRVKKQAGRHDLEQIILCLSGDEKFKNYLNKHRSIAEKLRIISLTVTRIQKKYINNELQSNDVIKKIGFLCDSLLELKLDDYYQQIDLSSCICQILKTIHEVVKHEIHLSNINIDNLATIKFNELFTHLSHCEAFFHPEIVYSILDLKDIIQTIHKKQTSRRKDKSQKSPINISATSIDNFLSTLLLFHKPGSFKTPLKAKYIKEAIYGIGKLARANVITDQIKIENIADLLNILIQDKQLTARDISNTTYGISLLAQAKIIKGNLNHEIINNLIEKLTSTTNYTSQDIANLLYAIGLLAQANLINEPLDHRAINQLMEQLTKVKDCKAQAIANTLYGAGLLAQANLIDKPLDHRVINKLMKQLTKMTNCNSQDIANTLYDIGLLAQANLIDKPLDHLIINQLMEQLTKMTDCKSQNIANTLYGIGLLAQANLIDNPLNHRVINQLMRQLTTKLAYNSQDIANTLYGIGLLAQANLIDKPFDHLVINQVMKQLAEKSDCISQAIANTLYGIGLLAQVNLISKPLDHRVINQLMEQLTKMTNCKAQDIANTLYGVGLLAQANLINGLLNHQVIEELITKLASKKSYIPQEIANALYGIGLLIQAKKIKYQFQEETIKKLLKKLLSVKNITAQDISNTLYGISLLKDNHALTPSAYLDEVTKLLSQMNRFSADSSTIQEFCNAIYAVYLLFTNTKYQIQLKNIVTGIIKKIEERLDPLSIEQKDQLFIVKTTWDIKTLLSLEKNIPIIAIAPNEIQITTSEKLATKPNISQVKCEHIVQCWPIDIYLKMGNQPFLIELDGPSHYTTNLTKKMQEKWQSTCENTHVFNQGYQALRHRDQLRDDFLYKKHQGITLRIANYFNYTPEELADIIYKKCQQIHTKNLQHQSCETKCAALVGTAQPVAVTKPSSAETSTQLSFLTQQYIKKILSFRKNQQDSNNDSDLQQKLNLCYAWLLSQATIDRKDKKTIITQPIHSTHQNIVEQNGGFVVGVIDGLLHLFNNGYVASAVIAFLYYFTQNNLTQYQDLDHTYRLLIDNQIDRKIANFLEENKQTVTNNDTNTDTTELATKLAHLDQATETTISDRYYPGMANLIILLSKINLIDAALKLHARFFTWQAGLYFLEHPSFNNKLGYQSSIDNMLKTGVKLDRLCRQQQTIKHRFTQFFNLSNSMLLPNKSAATTTTKNFITHQ